MKAADIIKAWRDCSSFTLDGAIIADPELRERIYQELHPTPQLEDRSPLLALFSLEMAYRLDQSNDGEYFENIYWCALFLYQLGFLDAVLPMWRAKHLDMDTGCGFDIQFLVGAGVDRTLSFLSAFDDSDAREAHSYILSCKESGDFSELSSWLQGRIEYYS